jgi:CRISPR-associated endonuclease/helicase Cas3
VLIATQVVEVSLDIDFDILYTEPAPLEALVQRLGQVNRGRRHASSDVHVMRQPGPGRDVYDAAYVTSAVDLLGAHKGRVLDEADVGPWLDRVYEGETAKTWAEGARRARDEFRAVCIADLRAFQSDPRLAEVFDRRFDGTEVLPRACSTSTIGCRSRSRCARASCSSRSRTGQPWRLRRAGRVATGRADLLVVDAPYDSERGLSLEAPGSAARDCRCRGRPAASFPARWRSLPRVRLQVVRGHELVTLVVSDIEERPCPRPHRQHVQGLRAGAHRFDGFPDQEGTETHYMR